MNKGSITRRVSAVLAATTLFAFIGVTTAGVAGASARPRALANVTVAANGTNINDLPQWVGQSDGYYAQQGLNVTFVVLATAALSAAIDGGEVQFLEDSATNYLTAVEQGLPQEAIEAIGFGLPVGLILNKAFAAAHGLTAQTPTKTIAQDLIGTTDGSSAAAVTGQFGLFLRANGVQLSQVHVASFASITAEEAALESGQVDEIVTSEPTPLILQAEGYGTLVATPSTVPGWTAKKAGLSEVVVTSTTYANANPGTVRKYVLATQAADKYISHHEKQVLPIVVANQPGVTRSDLLKAYSIINWATTGALNANMLRTAIATNVKIGAITALKLTENVNWTNKFV